MDRGDLDLVLRLAGNALLSSIEFDNGLKEDEDLRGDEGRKGDEGL